MQSIRSKLLKKRQKENDMGNSREIMIAAGMPRTATSRSDTARKNTDVLQRVRIRRYLANVTVIVELLSTAAMAISNSKAIYHWLMFSAEMVTSDMATSEVVSLLHD